MEDMEVSHRLILRRISLMKSIGVDRNAVTHYLTKYLYLVILHIGYRLLTGIKIQGRHVIVVSQTSSNSFRSSVSTRITLNQAEAQLDLRMLVLQRRLQQTSIWNLNTGLVACKNMNSPGYT